MLLHHIVVPFCFCCALWFQRYTPTLAVTLMCEINSVALHLRIVTNALQADMPAVSRGVFWFALATFLVFRLTAHPYVLVYVLAHRDDFDEAWHFWVAAIGISAINIMNLGFAHAVVFAERARTKKYGVVGVQPNRRAGVSELLFRQEDFNVRWCHCTQPMGHSTQYGGL